MLRSYSNDSRSSLKNRSSSELAGVWAKDATAQMNNNIMESERFIIPMMSL